MTHATPIQQLELSDTLRSVRNRKFPGPFDRAYPVNKLILTMLSDDPDKRPRTNDILQDLQRLHEVKQNLSPMKSRSSPQKLNLMNIAI